MTLRRLHIAILRGAASLVPAPERAEWFAEWKAELWYVNHSATAFCFGSFHDAFWLRRNSPSPQAGRRFALESPVGCVLFLAVLAALSLLLAIAPPLSRDMLLPSPYRHARNLAMISAAGHYHAPIPTVPIEQYLSLANRMPNRFTALTFYRPVQSRVETSPQASEELSVALASANLFQVLEIPIPPAAPRAGARQSATPLVLSHAAWRKYFDCDPHIVGRVLEVTGQPAVISGVIDAGPWSLPGQVDVWLLQDQAHLAQLPPHTEGFMLGRIAISASQPRPESDWSLSVPNGQGGAVSFTCSPLAEDQFALGCLEIYLASLLVLLAITPLGLGDYPANRYAPSVVIRLRRWVFLTIKIALLVLIVWCGGIALTPVFPPVPTVIVPGLILGFRWALTDQRQRCPVCLRLLANPTPIGDPSQAFLGWYGTELICTHGHGLLYVPEIRTSWFGTQRWQYLDPTWRSLFS
jgi:hypothetical protein